VNFSLRRLGAEDVDALVALDSDPEVMRYITGGLPTSRAAYEQVLLPRMLGQATAPGLGFFAVESPKREFLGWVHLRRDTFEPAWAELGYRFKRVTWGKGLATRVSRTLVARAFDELGFETVSARTVPENLASRRVMEKLGMKYAGEFEFPGSQLPGMVLPPLPGVLYLLDRD
jgi:RimJ/RimL family protein N-acetyltransferase